MRSRILKRWVWSIQIDTKNQDEATSAYMDIDVVMNNQKDLAEIVVELTPLAVLKG